MDPILMGTLQKYTEKMDTVVEQNISNLLGDILALIFDGWSHFETN